MFAGRYSAQGLAPAQLAADMADELEDCEDEAVGSYEEREKQLKAIGQHTIGARRKAGPIMQAIISRYNLQEGQRVGLVETYRCT